MDSFGPVFRLQNGLTPIPVMRVGGEGIQGSNDCIAYAYHVLKTDG